MPEGGKAGGTPAPGGAKEPEPKPAGEPKEEPKPKPEGGKRVTIISLWDRSQSKQAANATREGVSGNNQGVFLL